MIIQEHVLKFLEKEDVAIIEETGTFHIPDEVEIIGDEIFMDLPLVTIDIPEGVLVIGESAFANCHLLEKVFLPDSIEMIDQYAFAGCEKLKSIYLPEGLDTIEEGAFSGCSSLSSILIPSTVTFIGYFAFEGCISLSSMRVDDDNETYDSRYDCNAIIETENNKLLFGSYKTIIPEGTKIIGSGAFKKCRSLKVMHIPTSVHTIEFRAFEDCSSLMSILIPNSVTIIEDEAFVGCSNLTILVEEYYQPIDWSEQWNIDDLPVRWGVMDRLN